MGAPTINFSYIDACSCGRIDNAARRIEERITLLSCVSLLLLVTMERKFKRMRFYPRLCHLRGAIIHH